MEYRRTYSAARRTRSACLTALLVVAAALAVVLGYRSLAPSPSAATLWTAEPSPSSVAADPPAADPPAAMPRADRAVSRGGGAFDGGSPEVAKLDPDLLVALRLAEADAAGDGVRFTLNSGWRSAEHQEQLFREAVATYGSEAEAARWVAPPATSAHVSGDAVDIGPADAAAWLGEHGPWYGLCQIYENEPWHFELRPDAAGQGCPPMYPDAAGDPRLRR